MFERLLNSEAFATAVLDFYQYGESWRKPTRLFFAFVNLRSVGRVCQGSFACCSYTGKRHVALKGTNDQGIFLTLIAQPYPFELCRTIAAVVIEQIGWQNATG